MSSLFQKIAGLGNSPTDKLISNLLTHYRKWKAEPSHDNHYAFAECVEENLGIIDAQFLGYLNRKAAHEIKDGDLTGMQEMLHETQFFIVLGELKERPPFGLKPFVQLMDDPNLTDEDVEEYLRTASKRYHYSTYAPIIFLCKQILNKARLGAPDWKVENLKRIIGIAERLRDWGK